MVRSPYPDVEIPAVSIHEFLFGDLDESQLDAVALIDGMNGATTTYRQLVGQIDLFAGALAARGVGVGTRVGVLCPNVPAFATVFHGILRAGATATTKRPKPSCAAVALGALIRSVAKRLPGSEIQALPRRPRPLDCIRAAIHTGPLSPAAARRRASSLVESSSSNRMSRTPSGHPLGSVTERATRRQRRPP